MSRFTPARSAVCGLLAAGVIAAVPAAAQDPRPTPTSCAGLTFTDPEGDAQISALTLSDGTAIGPPGDTPENLDLLQGFFRYAPTGGANVLTANLVVKKLDKTVAANFDGAAWYFYFDVDGATRYVNAAVDADGATTFTYGTFLGNSNTKDGDTTGKFHEGDKGVISIVVPVKDMSLEGKTLEVTNGEARASGLGFVWPADQGPDAGEGKPYKVTPCAEAGSPTQPGPTAGGTTAPPPGSGQQTGSGQQPAPGAPGGQSGGAPGDSATLNLTVTAPKLSARKLAKKRAAVFTLNARENITALTARLFRGSAAKPTVIAKGRLARVNGRAKLKLKIARKAARKLKKGTYTLELTGRNAAGQSAKVAVQVRVGR